MNSVPSNLDGGNKKPVKAVDMSVYIAEALAQHFEIMGSIADSLDTIALYFERKGESENVWRPDDLEDQDEDEVPDGIKDIDPEAA